MFYTPSSRIGQNIMRIELLDTYGILRIKTTEFLFDLEDLPLIQGGATVGTVTRTVILSAATFIMAFDALSGSIDL